MSETEKTEPNREASPEETEAELWSGEAVSLSDVRQLTGRYPFRLVVVAGPVDTGKTTLVASIFQMYEQGEFAKHRFAGSDTLIGLERIVHKSRIASNRASPHTDRTPFADEPSFLHFALQPVGGGPLLSLLLTDIAGEVFRRVRDSESEAASLSFMQIADRLVVLVDGNQVAGSQSRNTAFVDASALIRSLLDAKVLLPRTKIDVVVTKWDLLVENRQALQFVDAQLTEMARRFAERVHLRFMKVAARPERPNLPFAFNVEDLVVDWLPSHAQEVV